MRSRKEYIQKLDGISKQLKEAIENSPGKRKQTVTLDKKLAQDLLDYFQELTDMYTDFSIGPKQ